MEGREDMDKRKIRNYIILVVLILLCVAIIGNLGNMHEKINLNDSNTRKFYATVERIYRVKNMPESFFIETKEFNADLFVEKAMCDQVGAQWDYTLHAGDQIAFRILDVHVPSLMHNDSWCHIVELETEGDKNFSLADYNHLAAKYVKPSMIKGSILLAVCFLSLVWFVHRIRMG